MGIVRKIDEYIKFELSKSGAAICASDNLEIVRHGPIADINPSLAVDWANHCIEWRIREYSGYTRIRRMDLTSFWRDLHNTYYARALVIKPHNVRTTHDILKDINEFTLLDLSPEDVVDAPIPDGKYTEVTITLTNNCIWFTGKLTLPLQFPMMIVDGKQIISLPLDHRLRVVDDPLDNSARYNGNLLTYNHNFNDLLISDHSYSHLSNYVTISNSSANMIIAELKTKGVTAVYTNKLNFPGINLYNARQIYCGPTEGYVDGLKLSSTTSIEDKGFGPQHWMLNKARTDVEYVTVIAVDSAYCAVLDNEPIFLHFNLDPNYKRVTIDRPPVHYWPLTTDRKNRGTANLEFRPPGLITILNRNCDVGFLNAGIDFTSPGTQTSGLGFEIDLSQDFTLSFDMLRSTTTPWSSQGDQMFEIFDYTKPNDPRLKVEPKGYVTFASSPQPRYHTIARNIRQEPPHWTTITVVKRGKNLLVYLNCQVANIYLGIPTGKWNAILIKHQVSNGLSFRDFRYFDYAIDARQVIDVSLGRMDPVYTPVAKKELPEPLHYWPLNGDVNNLGVAGTPLSRIFNYINFSDKHIPNLETKKFAILTTSSNANFGVDLDITKDFTLAFDLYVNNDAPNGGFTTYDLFTYGNVSEPGKFVGIKCSNGPMIATNTPDPESHRMMRGYNIVYTNGSIIRYHVVRKGDNITLYGNGEYMWTCVYVSPSFTCLNTYARYGHSYIATRNWAYYDCALDNDQVIDEVEFSFKLSKK